MITDDDGDDSRAVLFGDFSSFFLLPAFVFVFDLALLFIQRRKSYMLGLAETKTTTRCKKEPNKQMIIFFHGDSHNKKPKTIDKRTREKKLHRRT